MPKNSLPLVNMLPGMVAAVTTQVVNDRCGSSSGSAAKSDQMAAFECFGPDIGAGPNWCNARFNKLQLEKSRR